MYLLWSACWGGGHCWLVWWGIHCWLQCTVLLCSKLTSQSLSSNSRILQIIRLPGGMTQCLPTPSLEIDPITCDKLLSSATAGLVANFGTFNWWIQSLWESLNLFIFCFFSCQYSFGVALILKATLRYWLTDTLTVKTLAYHFHRIVSGYFLKIKCSKNIIMFLLFKQTCYATLIFLHNFLIFLCLSSCNKTCHASFLDLGIPNTLTNQ